MTGADLPSEYTFQASDNGSATFQVTFRTPSTTMSTILSVTDGSLLSTATPIVTAGATRDAFLCLCASTSATQDSPALFMVVALDAKNHIVTNYTGTVHLTSSDPSAILPGRLRVPGGRPGREPRVRGHVRVEGPAIVGGHGYVERRDGSRRVPGRQQTFELVVVVVSRSGLPPLWG